jgi:ankyrin repeat protein
MDEAERTDEKAGQKLKAVPQDYELIAACSRHDVEKVKELLSRGANPNARSFSSSGGTEEWPTEYSSSPDLIIAFPSIEIVRLLLEAGADPNCASEQVLERGEYGSSALSTALGLAKSHPEDPRYSEVVELLRNPWSKNDWAILPPSRTKS